MPANLKAEAGLGEEKEEKKRNACVFIGQLPFSRFFDADLYDLLEPYGTVVSVRMHPSKAEAFVRFDSVHGADAAIAALHGRRTLPGRHKPLQIFYASRSPRWSWFGVMHNTRLHYQNRKVKLPPFFKKTPPLAASQWELMGRPNEDEATELLLPATANALQAASGSKCGSHHGSGGSNSSSEELRATTSSSSFFSSLSDSSRKTNASSTSSASSSRRRQRKQLQPQPPGGEHRAVPAGSFAGTKRTRRPHGSTPEEGEGEDSGTARQHSQTSTLSVRSAPLTGGETQERTKGNGGAEGDAEEEGAGAEREDPPPEEQPPRRRTHHKTKLRIEDEEDFEIVLRHPTQTATGPRFPTLRPRSSPALARTKRKLQRGSGATCSPGGGRGNAAVSRRTSAPVLVSGPPVQAVTAPLPLPSQEHHPTLTATPPASEVSVPLPPPPPPSSSSHLAKIETPTLATSAPLGVLEAAGEVGTTNVVIRRRRTASSTVRSAAPTLALPPSSTSPASHPCIPPVLPSSPLTSSPPAWPLRGGILPHHQHHSNLPSVLHVSGSDASLSPSLTSPQGTVASAIISPVLAAEPSGSNSFINSGQHTRTTVAVASSVAHVFSPHHHHQFVCRQPEAAVLPSTEPSQRSTREGTGSRGGGGASRGQATSVLGDSNLSMFTSQQQQQQAPTVIEDWSVDQSHASLALNVLHTRSATFPSEQCADFAPVIPLQPPQSTGRGQPASLSARGGSRRGETKFKSRGGGGGVGEAGGAGILESGDARESSPTSVRRGYGRGRGRAPHRYGRS